jgi:DNA invertase Pin-like site-specific DNA recombinase
MVNEIGNKEHCNPHRCGIYTRSASTTQENNSLIEQVRRCREAAAEHGWVVEENYVRHEVTSYKTSLHNRHGLNSLIEDAKSKPRPYDILVVDDTSRLGRDLGIALQVIDEFHQNGVSIHFVARKCDSRHPSFQELLTLHEMVDVPYIPQ